jgi:DNA adenine methylase
MRSESNDDVKRDPKYPEQMAQTAVVPFLKWPGGKRWAAPFIVPFISERLTRCYYEPFLGGGAVYFHLMPRRSLLSDSNADLINTYEIVRAHTRAIINRLQRLEVSERTYYQVRRSEPSNSIERACKFLYLNRLAFAGMYRVNQDGEFNVPYGGGQRGLDIFWESSILRDASRALRKVRLRNLDFENALDLAGKGDVVYCDPTYTVTHDSNCFVRYNEKNFSWADQERLAKAAARAKRRGASVIVSNAHHISIRRIYSQGKFLTLYRTSNLSPDESKRRVVKEYLIVC